MGKSMLAVFLVVLAIAVSLVGAMFSLPIEYEAAVHFPVVSKSRPDLVKFYKDGKKIFKNLENTFESVSSGKTQGIYYLKVAAITVGQGSSEKKLDIKPEETGVILSTEVPFWLLDQEAYGLLKKALPPADATSEGLAAWDQLCYASEDLTAMQVTLVLASKKDEMKTSHFWGKQNDGSVCLSILESPLP